MWQLVTMIMLPNLCPNSTPTSFAKRGWGKRRALQGWVSMSFPSRADTTKFLQSVVGQSALVPAGGRILRRGLDVGVESYPRGKVTVAHDMGTQLRAVVSSQDVKDCAIWKGAANRSWNCIWVRQSHKCSWGICAIRDSNSQVDGVSCGVVFDWMLRRC